MPTHYPAIIIGDEAEGYCAIVTGTPALGDGATAAAALTNASEILAELIQDASAAGSAPPSPAEPTAEERGRGQLAVIQIADQGAVA